MEATIRVLADSERRLLDSLEWLEDRRAELVRELGRVPTPCPDWKRRWVADRERALAGVRASITRVRSALGEC